ncbi:hypothetical protein BDDG_13888, partial [Blastomyces dermatitidis ATCC 18188]
MNTLQSHVLETQSMHSVSEITKLVSINVKHAQKEVKFINILCLSALMVKKNMHLAQKNVCLLLELKRTGEKMKLKVNLELKRRVKPVNSQLQA